MDSYRIFHADTYLRTPKSQFWNPNHSNFIEKRLLQILPRLLQSLMGCTWAWGWIWAGFLEGHMRSSMLNNS